MNAAFTNIKDAGCLSTSQIQELEIAIRFGHVDGYSGWEMIRDQYQASLQATPDTPSNSLRRLFFRVVVTYANNLLGEQSAWEALYDCFDDAYNAGPVVLEVRANTEHPEEELEAHRKSVEEEYSSPLSRWYVAWIDSISAYVVTFAQKPGEVEAAAIVDTILSENIPVVSDTKDPFAEGCPRFFSGVQRLAVALLQAHSYSVISPIPGVDVFSPQVHQLREPTTLPRDAKVGRVHCLGLAKGARTLRAAVVDPEIKAAVVPEPSEESLEAQLRGPS